MLKSNLIIIIAFGFVILLLVGFFMQSSKINKSAKVLGVSSVPSISPDETLTPSPTSSPTLIPKPTTTNQIIITPTSSPDNSSSSNLTSWIYPGATIISTSEKSITLQSNDSTELVTNWYKNRIQNEKMNVKSFVTTNSNGNVSNKLAGASSSESVSAEIKRDSGSSTTNIVVTL